MYYVYLLKSKSSGIYIGYTNDLKKRLKHHNNGYGMSTKNGAPWELVYYESYKNREDATNREKMLKQDGRSRAWLKKRVTKSLSGD